MTPRRGRKRYLRRTCSPPLCVPMPRPCLDSLQIPIFPSCALHRSPRTELVPRFVQPFCSFKHRICHCADKNDCSAETCTNCTGCMQTPNFFCPHGLKRDKYKDGVCNGPYHQQEGRERNNVEDYEIAEPVCNEALCEESEYCRVGALSNDEELIPPITYTPSVTNQSSFSRTPPIVSSKQEHFDNDSAPKIHHINVSFPDNEITQKSKNFDEGNKSSNVNRYVQVNSQNETVSSKGRDARSSFAPDLYCSGNEVPNALSLSGSSHCELSDVDNMSAPVKNIQPYFNGAIEKYNPNAQSHSQSFKAPELRLNTPVSNVDDNGRYFRDNAISLNGEYNNNPNRSAQNPCCKYSFDPPASEYESHEQLNYTENREFGNVYQRSRELSQQHAKQFSEQYGNQAKSNNINATSMQSAPQRSPGTNKDNLRIRDNLEYISSKENVLSNCTPPSFKTMPYGNASNSNELAKSSLSGNNSTHERRLFNEGKNQFMSSAPDDCCKSGTTQGYVDSCECTRQKPSKFMTSSTPKSRPLRSYTKTLLSNKSSQVKFHGNNHINNATYCSPTENQNRKYKTLPRPSKIKTNDYSPKFINNKIRRTNSAFVDKNGDVCEDCKQDYSTYDKPTPNISCACPNEDEFRTESKIKQKNIRNCTTYDSQDFICTKKPACLIVDGTTSCASMTCVVNQHLACSCRYPPAFKQFSCTGNISGVCNCDDNE